LLVKHTTRVRKHNKRKEKSITYDMRGDALFQQEKRIGNIRQSFH